MPQVGFDAAGAYFERAWKTRLGWMTGERTRTLQPLALRFGLPVVRAKRVPARMKARWFLWLRKRFPPSLNKTPYQVAYRKRWAWNALVDGIASRRFRVAQSGHEAPHAVAPCRMVRCVEQALLSG